MTASAPWTAFRPVMSSGARRTRVATPDEVRVWVGLDVGKDKHFAVVVDDVGEELFACSVGNDVADIDAVLDRAAETGPVGLVIDQPGSIAQLAIAIADR